MSWTRSIGTLAMFALATPHALAEDLVAAPLVTGGATTIIYVFPTSPQTFVPVAGLPSFLVMPGAPVPAVATEVVYSAPGPVPSTAVASVKVDCRNFGGVVTIAGPDVFNLDKDNDGVGCEPEDR